MTEWRWPNFTEYEFRCRCGCGRADMVPEFLDRLQSVRNEFGPMVISSGFRCPEYNAKISSTGKDGPHTTGRAVDVLVSGWKAAQLTALAVKNGFTGIGWSQRGLREKRFVHIDDLSNESRPATWSY